MASVDLEAVVESLAPRLIAHALARTGRPGTAEWLATSPASDFDPARRLRVTWKR